MAEDEKSRWRRFLPGFLVIAALAVAVGMLVFSSWSEMESATAEEAEQVFAEVLRASSGGPAYVEIGEDGAVRVRRELEREEPVELEAFCLAAWDPKNGKLLRVRFPYWFVRIKSTRTINLGTLISFLARDWEHLDLRVAEEDLEKRGPGLVLDHERADGARILLWAE
jgi:hypothetical protein